MTEPSSNGSTALSAGYEGQTADEEDTERDLSLRVLDAQPAQALDD